MRKSRLTAPRIPWVLKAAAARSAGTFSATDHKAHRGTVVEVGVRCCALLAPELTQAHTRARFAFIII